MQTVRARTIFGTDGRRIMFSGSAGGTLRHIAYRKPGVAGKHDLDNNLIGYRSFESECFDSLCSKVLETVSKVMTGESQGYSKSVPLDCDLVHLGTCVWPTIPTTSWNKFYWTRE